MLFARHPIGMTAPRRDLSHLPGEWMAGSFSNMEFMS